jgi:hypothetical protein
MACPDCGSWSVKADRGLSGRMVCGRCGRPLGLGSPSRRRGAGRRSGWAGRAIGWTGRPSMAVALALLLACGALITAAVEQLAPKTAPTPGLLPSPDRNDPKGKESVKMIRNIAS